MIDLLLDAPVSLILIAMTITISVFAFNNPKLLDALMLDVVAIRRRGQVWRLITCGFVHGDYMHLFFNMLTLVFFGPFVELSVNRERFVILYFGSLLAGSALSLLENFRKDYRSLGASGATAGVTVALAIIAPLTSINVFLVLPVPAILYAVAFVGFSAYGAYRIHDRISHTGHLGGALAGIAISCLLWPQVVRRLPEALGLPSF